MKSKAFLVVITILIIIIAILLFFTLNNVLNKNNGDNQDEIDKSNAIANTLSLSIIRINYDLKYSDDTINREYTLILNKDGKVIDTRVKEKGYSNENLQKQYNNIKLNTPFNTNVSIKDTYLYYNTNFLNGNTVEEVTNSLKSLSNYKYEEL